MTSCYMTCVKTPLCKTVAFNDQNLNGGGERKGECVLLNSLPEEEQQNCLKTKNLMSNDGFAKIKKGLFRDLQPCVYSFFLKRAFQSF